MGSSAAYWSLLAERGVDVDHVTLYRWVQRFAPLLAEAARPCRHAVGDRWWADAAGTGAIGTITNEI